RAEAPGATFNSRWYSNGDVKSPVQKRGRDVPAGARNLAVLCLRKKQELRVEEKRQLGCRTPKRCWVPVKGAGIGINRGKARRYIKFSGRARHVVPLHGKYKRARHCCELARV